MVWLKEQIKLAEKEYAKITDAAQKIEYLLHIPPDVRVNMNIPVTDDELKYCMDPEYKEILTSKKASIDFSDADSKIVKSKAKAELILKASVIKSAVTQELKDGEDIDAMLKEEGYEFRSSSAPPNLEVIRAKWKLALKDNLPENHSTMFAVSMCIQGFKGDNVGSTVSIVYKKRELKLSDALKSNFSFSRREAAKGPDAINPRRVCLAYSKDVRRYLEKNPNIVTSLMKKYGSFERFLFIGGQSTITNPTEAKRMFDLTAKVDGELAASKLRKYFVARRLNWD
jgi:hypothetical protein